MRHNELMTLKENRLEGETLNATRQRLQEEGKLALSISSPSTTALEKPVEADEDGFVPEDLVIPRYKITQPTSRGEGTNPGKFQNALTNEAKDKLEKVIFLKRQNGRVLFPKNDFSGKRLCWSYDGAVPAIEEILAKTRAPARCDKCVTGNNGTKIVHCPFAQWKDVSGTQFRQPPECKETINFLGLDNFMPFFVSFHGTAIPIVKKLLSSIYLKKKQAVLQGKNLQLRDFRVTLGLKLETNDKGKFYVPVMESVEEITDEEERAILSQCCESLQKRSLAETVAVEEKVAVS